MAPTLIDAKVWRMNSIRPRTTVKYRGQDEIDEVAAHDPIARFGAWLMERGWLNADDLARAQAKKVRR